MMRKAFKWVLKTNRFNFFATGDFRLTYDSDTGAISGQEQLVPFTVFGLCIGIESYFYNEEFDPGSG